MPCCAGSHSMSKTAEKARGKKGELVEKAYIQEFVRIPGVFTWLEIGGLADTLPTFSLLPVPSEVHFGAWCVTLG